ncbi:MAG: S41 family peptidase [Parvularculaceae bacterium]
MITRRNVVEAVVGLPLLAAYPAFAAAHADWGQDIRLLRRAYTALHPGLYRYATPAQVSARLDRLEASFAKGPALGEAYLQLSEFLASLQCGHSYANFYNQSDAVASALFNARSRLPFFFRWLDGAMIVTGGSDDPVLAAGTEIRSINGVSAQETLKALMPYARADGGNDAKRRALLEVSGLDAYETFDIFHSLKFPPASDMIALKVRTTPGGPTRKHAVRALDLAERRAMSASDNPDADAPQWTFAWMAERTGLLTMPGWALFNSKWDWRAFLDGVFAELADRGATGLVVDLRGNEGGLDCGHLIIARLIDKDLVIDGGDRKVRYRKVPDALNPYLDTWDNSFRDWGDDAVAVENGFYRQTKYDDDARGEVIAPMGPRFAGKVAILIDAQNSSATFQFASIVQSNRLATLIGEPTGGNKRGINGGAFFFMRLPKSGIEVDLPLIGYFPTTPQPDEGLKPDIIAAPSIEDIRSSRDRVKEKALAFVSA